MPILEFGWSTFGENLRAFRLTQGMTLAKMANQTGLSLSYLSDIERGRTSPSLKTIEKIASSFGARVLFSFVYDNVPPELVVIPRTKIKQIRDILNKYDKF
jgi:transcriptional regulator with XRE-family HTH domain